MDASSFAVERRSKFRHDRSGRGVGCGPGSPRLGIDIRIIQLRQHVEEERYPRQVNKSNDEVGTMNDELRTINFIVHRSYFIVPLIGLPSGVWRNIPAARPRLVFPWGCSR